MSGSFIRIDKAQSGQSAVSAVTSRYGQVDDDLTAKFNEQQLLSIQKSINAPFLKLVGFDKVTNKQRLVLSCTESCSLLNFVYFLVIFTI